jgi:hypothetical protein
LQNYGSEISTVDVVTGLVNLPERHEVASQFEIPAQGALQMLLGHDPADVESGDYVVGVPCREQSGANASE